MSEAEIEAKEDRMEAYTDLSVFIMMIGNIIGWGTYACWMVGGGA